MGLDNIFYLSKIKILGSYILITLANSINSLVKIVNSFNCDYYNKFTRLVN